MQPGERYGIYDQFAWFYVRGWGLDFHNQARPVLDDHVFPLLGAGARVLDLCCGSGDLSRVLVAQGYQVTGVDGSEEMLRYAREQVREAVFRLGDARSFSFDQGFDAALSTFDSLNHVLAPDELDSVFASVFRALLPGGLFVFDLNMREAFETLWHGTFASVDDQAAGITIGSFDAEASLGRADVTLFRLAEDGRWRRSDIRVQERCYARDEVTGALSRAGFSGIEAREAWALGMRGDVALGREWFFARKL
jgi:SAM-dependent methyltransferase